MQALRLSFNSLTLQRASPSPLSPCTCSLGIRGSKKRPRKFHNQRPKPPSTKPVGFGPGERHPRLKLTVAHLVKDQPGLGKEGETVLVNKSNLRNHLVPDGIAQYVVGGRPVLSGPAPFRDWEPEAAIEARTEARRDREIIHGYPYLPLPRRNLIEQNQKRLSEIGTLLRKKQAEATSAAFKGGMDRRRRNLLMAKKEEKARRKRATVEVKTAPGVSVVEA